MGNFFALLTLFLTLAKNVEQRGVLNVTFVDYVNPGKKDYSGGDGDECCDTIFCDDCDTYFEICLQATYTPVASLANCLKFVRTKVREDDNFKFISAYGTQFGSNGERNPIEYQFDDSWKGTFSIFMNIWDSDSGNLFILGGARDRIDIVFGSYQYLIADRHSAKPKIYQKTLTGSRKNPTSTTIKLSLQCDRYYYDGYCSTYCKPQDSKAAGHYTCDRFGRKICRIGWQGTNCKTDMNSCRSQPCQHGGRCQNNGTSYYCQCSPGFKGNHCEKEIDLCASFPCTNNATCVNLRTDFKCQCLPGFNSRLCQNDMNSCRSQPCQHGGRCQNIGTSYYCQCSPGYQGNHCEKEFDLCASFPCTNNATCVNLRTDFKCQCLPGFNGRLCQNDMNSCRSQPCQHGGRCQNIGTSYYCQCSPGYQGNHCEKEFDLCASFPCTNNATCVNFRTDFKCQCPPGFSGRLCQNDKVVCKNEDNSICSAGWSGELCDEGMKKKRPGKDVVLTKSGKRHCYRLHM